MGKESEVRKDRTCRVCGSTQRRAAWELQAHAETCQRLSNIGLVAPERPDAQIILPGDTRG